MEDVFYPILKCRFKVSWDKESINQEDNIGFTEVTGLSYDLEVVEYRDGIDASLSKRKIAGQRKFGNVTLKRGVFKGVKDFYSWIDGTGGSGAASDFSVRKRKDIRRTITITLLDEESVEVVSWTLINAFPVKVQFTDLNADENAVAVDTMELAFEDMTVNYL